LNIVVNPIVKTLLPFGHLFITIMNIYIFYYEVLLGQSRTINELSDFHQKKKNKKIKKSQNIESSSTWR
jgi:hypothetical protein